MRNICILDTSILCVWLKIPGKESCGNGSREWNYRKVNHYLTRLIAGKHALVLPLAVIIEAGNHVANASGDRYGCAKKLSALVNKCAGAEPPWTAFSEQERFWNDQGLGELARQWPELAKSGISIADATIKQIADYYARMGWNVEIFTGDRGLKSYEPAVKRLVPRRRR